MEVVVSFYLWSKTSPTKLWVNSPLVDILELCQDNKVVGLQYFNVMAMGITWKVGDAWDIWKEEQMRPLDSGALF